MRLLDAITENIYGVRLLRCPACGRMLPDLDSFWFDEWYFKLHKSPNKDDYSLSICHDCSTHDYESIVQEIYRKPWYPLIITKEDDARRKCYYVITDDCMFFETGWDI